MENRRQGGRPGCVAAATVAGILILAAAAAGQSAAGMQRYVPLSQLNPAKFPVGTPLVTEGLYSGRIDFTLALRGSYVIFVLEPAVAENFRFADLATDSLLRLTGVTAFRPDTTTYYFSVTSMQMAPSARAKVVEALNDPRVNSRSLMEIGRWARERSREYNDERLESLAQAAFIRALKLKDLALPPEDYEGYFNLAEESTALLGRPLLREYYVRAGIDAFILASGNGSPGAYYEAARKAEELLPGSMLPEQLLQEGFVIESGRKEPAEADDFYALAAKAEDILGKGSHYLRFLEKGLDAERSALAQGDYSAYYGLARKVKEVYPGYPSYRSLVWEAIMLERSYMDIRDGQAWFRLGNRIAYFLGDEYQAGLCFKESIKLDPGNVEAREKLRELGHVYYQGRWWRSEELAKSEIFKKAQELEELSVAGEVAVGMTKDQVLRAKGEPDGHNASAGGWGVTTQWIYRLDRGALYVDMIAGMVVSKGEVRN